MGEVGEGARVSGNLSSQKKEMKHTLGGEEVGAAVDIGTSPYPSSPTSPIQLR
jgi:hypothetical protein